MALVDFHVEGFPSLLHHVCLGEYVLLNNIIFDRGGQNICRDCVDKLGGGVQVR